MTPTFTRLYPADLQKYFNLPTYEQARRLACQIKDAYEAKILTDVLLAKYLGITPLEVMQGIK